jgi:hypothetical protein
MQGLENALGQLGGSGCCRVPQNPTPGATHVDGLLGVLQLALYDAIIDVPSPLGRCLDTVLGAGGCSRGEGAPGQAALCGRWQRRRGQQGRTPCPLRKT